MKFLLVVVVLEGLISPETHAISTAVLDTRAQCEAARSFVKDVAADGISFGFRVRTECVGVGQ